MLLKSLELRDGVEGVDVYQAEDTFWIGQLAMLYQWVCSSPLSRDAWPGYPSEGRE